MPWPSASRWRSASPRGVRECSWRCMPSADSSARPQCPALAGQALLLTRAATPAPAASAWHIATALATCARPGASACCPTAVKGPALGTCARPCPRRPAGQRSRPAGPGNKTRAACGWAPGCGCVRLSGGARWPARAGCATHPLCCSRSMAGWWVPAGRWRAFVLVLCWRVWWPRRYQLVGSVLGRGRPGWWRWGER